MKSWILATRPKTLTAAFVPVIAGTALAYASGVQLKWSLTAFALLSAFFIQIGTNLVNDAIDLHVFRVIHECLDNVLQKLLISLHIVSVYLLMSAFSIPN